MRSTMRKDIVHFLRILKLHRYLKRAKLRYGNAVTEMCIRDRGYIEELLKTVGLDTVGEKKTKHYSLGMKQRLWYYEK